MKKIVFIGLMFFIIISQILADESLSKFENINFIFLNPLFFNYNHYILINYTLRNNIFANSDIYLKDSEEDYLFGEIYIYKYIYNEKLAGFLNFVDQFFQFLKLIDDFSGGPEKRRKEELEENKRYNILHPSEPPKKTR